MIHETHNLPPELEHLLREIAARHQRRLWLRGWARLGVAMLAILALLAALLALGPVPKGVALAVGALAAVAAAAFCLAGPLRSRIPLKQIAIYIDEHHPELENRIVSAVDFSSNREGIGSDVLIEKFYREIEGLVPDLALGDLLDTRALGRLARTAALLWVALLAVAVLIQQLWLPLPRLERGGARPAPREAAVKPPVFEVTPGDTRVRRGSNLTVLVNTNATGQNKVIQWRQAEGPWQNEAMQPSQSENVHYHQYLDLQDDVQYQVRVGEQSSPVYKIAVWTPPEVKAIDLSYHYPDYLKLADKNVANGGEISAVEGTKVELDVEVNKALAKAALVLESGARIELAQRTPGRWGGGIAVAKNDRYHVELLDREGEKNELNREFRITALPDKPPKIEIAFPRGDSEATAIEEIPLAFKVSDDYGLADYGVQYSVAGQKPVRVSLRTTATLALEAKGRHLLALESLGLQTGDLITWTVWATDQKPGRKEYETAGDPYFLEIRPFRRTYSEAVSNQGGEAGQQQDPAGAAGQEGDPQGRQSGDEKQVIIATWNLRREGPALAAAEFEKRRAAIVKAQQGLLDRAQQGAAGAMQTMLGGGGDSDAAAKSGAAMKEAVKSLGAAKLPSPEAELSEALVHEQEAYRQLLRNRPRQSQVMQARSQQRGSQSQQQRQGSQQELSQMELDRRRDFRDEASTQRTQQQQQQARNTASLDELKELAKRQQILNEDMAKLLSEKQTPKNETPEETQRRLERLRAEQQRNLEQLDQLAGEVASNNPEQRQTQQQLQDARQQMNRSADNLRQNRVQEARTAGSRALDSLGEAQSRFEQLGGATAGQRLADLRDQMKQLEARQDAITSNTQQLQAQSNRPGLERASATQGQVDDLLRQKEELSKGLKDLLGQAGDLSEKSAQNQQLMSRKLGDWIRATGSKGIPEAIDQGRPLLQFGVWGAAVNQEETVAERLKQSAAGLNAISDSMVQDDLQAMQKALEELRGIMNAQNRATTGTMTAQAGRGRQPNNATPTSGTQAQRALAGQTGQRQGQPGDAQQAGARGQQGQRGQGQQGQRGQGQPGDTQQAGARGQQGQRGQGQQGQRGQTGQRGQGQPGQGQPGDTGQEANANDQQGQQDGQPGDAQQGGARGQRGQGGRRGQAGQRGNGQQGQPGGDQQNQPGADQQDQTGADPQGQPGQQGGNRQGQPGGMRGNAGARGQAANGGGANGGGEDFANSGRGGLYQGNVPRTPEEIQRFFNGDYRRWADALRNAEALLPEDTATRGRIADIRNTIDTMRRAYLRDRALPQGRAFNEQVEMPLRQTASELEQEIARKLNAQEFNLSGEGAIPAQYTDRVAEYFKALSEQERAK